ncbi:Bark storage protein A [Vitis vinifera]|uniref:Bark storage protein A n=1 Tax=Vitis vinifera TaxID=29760 RepID=A0A438E235_VITVI|nr:Bark storage protein A [Vitis vinifera]
MLEILLRITIKHTLKARLLNVGITVQLLIDTFDVVGVVHYGIAGSTNDSFLIGDISVPKYVAQTSSWNGMEGALPELKFGDYNLPIKGENLLAEIEFTQVQLYSTGRPMQELFWLEIDPKWFNLATQLQACFQVNSPLFSISQKVDLQ